MFEDGDDENEIENQVVKVERQKVYVSFNKPNEKLVILNLPNQKFDQKLGRVDFKTEIDQG